MTEDEMVGWHHRLSGHGFEQAPGVGDGQGSLACCSPWGHKESDTTEQLNNNKNARKEITRVGVQWELGRQSRLLGGCGPSSVDGI